MAKEFTIREDTYIRANYLSQTDAQIGAHLKRGEISVRDYRRRNKLIKKPRKPKAPKQPHGRPLKKQEGDFYTKRSKGKPDYICQKAGGRWVPYHRHLWEQENGPIPAGHNLIFRDGNTMNCALDNLELISRAENVKRNTNRTKAAETLRGIWNTVQIMEAAGLKHRHKFRSKYAPKKKAKTPPPENGN